MNTQSRNTSALSVFDFQQHSVRVLMKDGEPWFVAADVLAALTLDRKALERLDEDEKGVSSIHTPGGAQEMTVTNETGLYGLILGSRKPEAKQFRRWVTHEVLPAIRKTGTYSTETTGDVPSFLRKRWLVTFDETGREKAVPLRDDALLMGLAALPAFLKDGDFSVESSLLLDLIDACTLRLRNRMEAEKVAHLPKRG